MGASVVYSESVFIAEDTKKKGLLTYWNKAKVSFNYRMNGLQFLQANSLKQTNQQAQTEKTRQTK